MSGPLLRLERVSKLYPSGRTHIQALSKIDLELEAGQFIAVMGKSGSGKSSLLQLIAGLDWPSDGKILWDGQDISKFDQARLANWRGTHTGFVFQTFNLIPSLNVRENVELPLLLAGINAKQRKLRALELIERVELGHRVEQKPPTLSGGEKQRVALARALAPDPELILADEPTGNLDETSGREILKLLTEFHSMGKSIILATHDRSAAALAERTFELKDGVLTKLSEANS